MKAMLLRAPCRLLETVEMPVPEPGPGQVLVQVDACAVCRTDLHVVDGELPRPKLPLIPGHEVVGRVVACGTGVESLHLGQRVGVPWLGWTCGDCVFCRSGRENLCAQARFTGYTLDGGFAEFLVAEADFCLPLSETLTAPAASLAPLLCAGLIGYRTLGKAGEARRIGLYGFGAAAHLVLQVARYQGREVFAFTRPGDTEAQAFARSLGAVWAGPSNTLPPEKLDAALLFAPVGSLIPQALRALQPGGVVVCGGIHMSDIPSFPYELLWQERSVCSVANLTRRDGIEFLELAPRIPIRTEVECFALTEANTALERLRNGKIRGAAVLVNPSACST
jgi:propanol-preferring alcohol dehydrogenase